MLISLSEEKFIQAHMLSAINTTEERLNKNKILKSYVCSISSNDCMFIYYSEAYIKNLLKLTSSSLSQPGIAWDDKYVLSMLEYFSELGILHKTTIALYNIRIQLQLQPFMHVYRVNIDWLGVDKFYIERNKRESIFRNVSVHQYNPKSDTQN